MCSTFSMIVACGALVAPALLLLRAPPKLHPLHQKMSEVNEPMMSTMSRMNTDRRDVDARGLYRNGPGENGADGNEEDVNDAHVTPLPLGPACPPGWPPAANRQRAAEETSEVLIRRRKPPPVVQQRTASRDLRKPHDPECPRNRRRGLYRRPTSTRTTKTRKKKKTHRPGAAGTVLLHVTVQANSGTLQNTASSFPPTRQIRPRPTTPTR